MLGGIRIITLILSSLCFEFSGAMSLMRFQRLFAILDCLARNWVDHLFHVPIIILVNEPFLTNKSVQRDAELHPILSMHT